jgi:uncharacterized protein (DUF58 family)
VLTRTGWLTAIAAVGAGIAGRLFAIVELFVIAAVLGALVLITLAWVRMTAVRLRVSRVVTPARVHAGESTRIEVSARNTGAGRTPVLHLSDPVAGTRGARLHLAPLRGNDTAQAAYRLPTDRRGIVNVGPLQLEIADPFGLARRRAIAAPVQSVTIYPHVDMVRVPSLGGDEDPHGAAIRTNKLGQTSEEFFALRQYVLGDDLRRVHWKSTARSQELMVRQDENPWQDRTTVALDVRPGSYDDAAFERAISAAASIASAAFRQRHVVRVVSSDAFDSGVGAGVSQAESILGYLAGVPMSKAAEGPMFGQLTRSGSGGLLVVITSEWPVADLAMLASLRARFRRVVLIGTTGSAPVGMPTGMSYVDNRGELDFPTAWVSANGRSTWSVPA